MVKWAADGTPVMQHVYGSDRWAEPELADRVHATRAGGRGV